MRRIENVAPALFPEFTSLSHVFPSTRYQGSKLKFVSWIWDAISTLPFTSMLDAFGGTGCVGFRCKQEGKQVVYNDLQPFNQWIGCALIENDEGILTENDIKNILSPHPEIQYPNFIQTTFRGVYYTEDENQWLDTCITNISLLEDKYKRALAYFALFQSCIIKRPYNLFHRANLNVRLREIDRSFGNKTTWDTPFETHFRHFVAEANSAVFQGSYPCYSLGYDILTIPHPESFDLVYLDPPYINSKGVGVDYGEFYHFLNGLVNYDKWGKLIDYDTKNLRMKRQQNIWGDKKSILRGFERLIESFTDSILVISYRSNGIPSIEQLLTILRAKNRETWVKYSDDIKYVLSHNTSQEVLIISLPQ